MKGIASSGFALLLVLILSLVHVACPTTDDDDQQQPPPPPVFDTLVDIDGNVYKTVVIGTQTWMAQNLRVNHYNDGAEIPFVDYSHWHQTGAVSGFLADSPDNGAKYGLLYNWHAVNTGKLAPDGWHVPTAGEWQTLIDYAGGADVAGGKLKEHTTFFWKAPNTGATNELSFTALPGYLRTASGHTVISSGELYYNTEAAGFWTSTENSSINAEGRFLRFDSEAVSVIFGSSTPLKHWGMSVRCVKD